MLFRIARNYRHCPTLLDRPKVVAEYLGFRLTIHGSTAICADAVTVPTDENATF